MRFSVLVVLMLAATFFSFAQNNDLNHGVLEQPQVVSIPNQNFSPLPGGGDVIINNYPQQQPVAQPVVRPRPYQPSLRRVITPPVEQSRKDTPPAVVPQVTLQQNFISENGIIWWIIVLTIIVTAIIFFVIGLLLFRNINNRNGCGCCRGGNCGDCGDRRIDHNFPNSFKHDVKVKVDVAGIPAEIILKAEMPIKAEEVTPTITNSDTKPIGQQ